MKRARATTTSPTGLGGMGGSMRFVPTRSLKLPVAMLWKPGRASLVPSPGASAGVIVDTSLVATCVYCPRSGTCNRQGQERQVRKTHGLPNTAMVFACLANQLQRSDM